MANYWQHPCKCLSCGLHFIVCSDYEKWPAEGTTEQMKAEDRKSRTGRYEKLPLAEKVPHLFCPECGKSAPMGMSMKMIQYPPRETPGFIFNAVG